MSTEILDGTTSERFIGGLNKSTIWLGSLRYRIGAIQGFPVRLEPSPDFPDSVEYVYVAQNDQGKQLMGILGKADASTLSLVIKDIEFGRPEYLEAFLSGDEKIFYNRREPSSNGVKNRESLNQEFLERCYMSAFEEFERRSLEDGVVPQAPLRYQELLVKGQSPIDMEGLLGMYMNLFNRIMANPHLFKSAM